MRGLSTGLPTADGDNGAGVDVAGVEPVFSGPLACTKLKCCTCAAFDMNYAPARAAGIKCCACAAFDMNYAPARATGILTSNEGCYRLSNSRSASPIALNGKDRPRILAAAWTWGAESRTVRCGLARMYR